MKKEPPRILAVNPGWHHLGIAVFRGSDILDWRVRLVTGYTLSERQLKIRSIVADLIEEYRPTVLAIKRLHRSRSSENLRKIARQIASYCRRRGIGIQRYSIQELEAICCPNMKANKRTLAGILANRYPVLRFDLQRELEKRNGYRIRMFEAVALGTACRQHMENK
jgi:Holliday junction resolvasome RuvABC endonuclease subunit